MTMQWVQPPAGGAACDAVAVGAGALPEMAGGSWMLSWNGTRVRPRSGRVDWKAPTTALSLFVYVATESRHLELGVEMGRRVVDAGGSGGGGEEGLPAVSIVVRRAEKRHGDGAGTDPRSADLFTWTVSVAGGKNGSASHPAVARLFPTPSSLDDMAATLTSPRWVGVSMRRDEEWKVEEVLQRSLSSNARQAEAAALRDRNSEAVIEGGEAAKQPWHDAPIIPLLPNTVERGANLLIVQFIVSLPFHLTATMHATPSRKTGVTPTPVSPACARLSTASVDGVRAQWQQRMCDGLGLCAHGLTGNGTGAQLNGGRRDGSVPSLSDAESLNATLSENATAAHQMAIAAVANLLGGITHFHGKQLVAANSDPGAAVALSAPHHLFTAVPSRSFFPRGFLWDEGFHQLIAAGVNPDLAWRAVQSWVDTMDAQGWIAREQILGGEARSRVPHQFQVQRPDIANPPSLLLPVLRLAVDGVCSRGRSGLSAVADPAARARAVAFCARHGAADAGGADGADVTTAPSPPAASPDDDPLLLHGGCTWACGLGGVHRRAPASFSPDQALATVTALTPKLATWGRWFLRTQAGEASGSYRWRGATKGHNFASGLDDYPRGAVPSLLDENVDLLAWMGFLAHNLADLTALAGDEADSRAWLQRRDDAVRRLVEVHWNPQAGVFCDLAVPAASLPTQPPGQPPAVDPPLSDRLPVEQVCHVGYVSVMPLLLRLLPVGAGDSGDRKRLCALHRVLSDPGELLSPYGLRSLAPSSPAYATEEDYWRQAVWINMNYLAITAARHYATALASHTAHATIQADGTTHGDIGVCGGVELGASFQALADGLREALVGNMARQWAATGFVWENYDSRSGRGRGTHPFTGWSALVALLVGGEMHGV